MPRPSFVTSCAKQHKADDTRTHLQASVPLTHREERSVDIGEQMLKVGFALHLRTLSLWRPRPTPNHPMSSAAAQPPTHPREAQFTQPHTTATTAPLPTAATITTKQAREGAEERREGRAEERRERGQSGGEERREGGQSRGEREGRGEESRGEQTLHRCALRT